MDEMKVSLVNINFPDIAIIDDNYLLALFDSMSVSNDIFGTRLVLQGVPFRPIKSNVRFIMQETTSVIGSNMDDINRLLITFGNQYETFVGTVVFIDIYGNVSDDLRNHIQFYLKRVTETGQSSKIIIKLCFDENVKVCIEDIMKNVGFVFRKDPTEGIWCTETKL